MTCVKMPANPESQNNSRSKWAEVAIKAFEAETGTYREDALADLLCDLMHWCDRNGLRFQKELERAENHYYEETYPVEALPECPF